MELKAVLLGSGPEHGPRAMAALIARVAGGGVFVIFGIGKFGDMVGAIIVSGIALGEVISLTLAPAELLVCLYLLWTGPGAFALDHRMARRATTSV
jgi:uncharacterized membrane protein YphA (DoxX/SURF4 family)